MVQASPPRRNRAKPFKLAHLPHDKLLLFGYFLGLILLGGILLSLPLAWQGAVPPLIDTWFIAVSAVCVTGLTPISITQMTFFGQTVLMVLIQLGGLGIITVTSLLFLFPYPKLSLESRNLIKDFFVSPLEFKAGRIIQKILGFTLILEGLGLFLVLITSRFELDFFSALFHTVSAFNNAGFSLYNQSLYALRNYPVTLFVFMFLVVAGGLGYVVWANFYQLAKNNLRWLIEPTGLYRKSPRPSWEGKPLQRLHPHSLLVLRTSLILLVTGFVVFYFLELVFGSFHWLAFDLWMDALMNSVMSRTAGFNYLFTANLSQASLIFMITLMLIGAGPASTSGGIKVTTFALFVHFLFKGHRPEIFLSLGKEEIRRQTIQRAVLLFNRYMVVFLVFSTALILTERNNPAHLGYLPYFFEAASALGTVGLSMGVTPTLSFLGKIIIMFAMFTGRVGLMAFIVWSVKDYPPLVRRSETEVLLG